MRKSPKFSRRAKAKREFAPLYIVDTVGVSHKLDNHKIGKYIQLGREENMANVATTPRHPATPEEVWATLDRVAKYHEESVKWRKDWEERQAEAERLRKEEYKERKEEHERWRERFEREKAESDKKLDRVSKNMGGINHSLGQLVETLIAARLWEKFSAYPYNLKRAYQRIPVYNEKNHTLTDIDILLVDGEWAMAVEVKREADNIGDVDHHVGRMARIKKYPPAEVVGKKLLGAIAGGVVSPDVRDKAHEAGFFVLELKGESVDLLPPPDGFVPSEW